MNVVANVTDAAAALLVPRGIRNNNPGNITRVAGVTWQGQLTDADLQLVNKRYDPQFVQFDTPANGVRALGRILQNYQRQGLTTVAQIIGRYSATDQAAYIQNVSDALGISPNDPVDVLSSLPALAVAIIQQECGQQPYNESDVAAWVYS